MKKTKMATLRFHFYFLIFCVSIAIFIPTCCHSKLCLPEKHAALFVFGDSLFDAGNNNYINTKTDYQANYSPYGETFFKYPTGRFSDGRTVPDFIAEYAKLPLTQPYLYPGYQQYIDGVNFASAGAGALVETHKGLVIDLKTQVSYFKKVNKLLRQKLGAVETKTLLEKAVYLFHTGSNDYLGPFEENSSIFTSYSPEKYVDLVIGNLTTVVEEIHSEGGRKFGFLNLGPLGCVPLARALINGTAGSCLEEVTALVKQHNSALFVVLQELEKQLKGFKYSLTDFYGLESDLMNYPTKYGFKEGNVTCCGSGPDRANYSCGGKGAVKEYDPCDNPSEYVFFDYIHPTERANELYAQLIWSGNRNITAPYNLKTLFED